MSQKAKQQEASDHVSDREMSRKALYNLLRMNWLENTSLEVAAWQVADYRSSSLDELFEELKKLGVDINPSSFSVYADSFEDPEDLSDSFVEDSFPVEKQDQIFLLIFELWRRFAQHKPTLSVFADELDHQIHLYDRSEESSEDLQNVLEYFLEIIEESSSQDEVFASLCVHCANDLEAFLYDYLADQLDQENYIYVSSFVDRVYDAIPYTVPFDFLKVRLTSIADIEAANESLMDLIEVLNEEPDFDISLEILQFLADQGAVKAFFNFTQVLCSRTEIKEDLLALAFVVRDFFEAQHQTNQRGVVEDLIQELNANVSDFNVMKQAFRKFIAS